MIVSFQNTWIKTAKMAKLHYKKAPYVLERVTAITTTSEQLGTTDNGNNLNIQVNNLPLQKLR